MSAATDDSRIDTRGHAVTNRGVAGRGKVDQFECRSLFAFLDGSKQSIADLVAHYRKIRDGDDPDTTLLVKYPLRGVYRKFHAQFKFSDPSYWQAVYIKVVRVHRVLECIIFCSVPVPSQ